MTHNDKAMDAGQSSVLRTQWFQRLEQLYQAIEQSSGLECATRCNARCCPKAKTSVHDDPPVGHVAILLPFELEYIVAKTDIDPAVLQQSSIAFSAGKTLNIGSMTSAKPCPFLDDENQCGIYAIRPLDCRSFPLIPVFSEQGTLSFRKDGDCPSTLTFASDYESAFKDLWQDLLPHLPMTYRLLYNAL